MSNRDIAALIVISLMLVLGLTRPSTRDAFRGVLSALACWKILLPLNLYILYLTGGVWAAAQLGLWNRELLGETILWFALGGLPLLMSIADQDRKSSFLKGHIRKILALTGVLIFVIHIANFNLWTEIIIQSIFMFLLLLGVVAKPKDEYRSVSTIVSVLIMIFILVFAARSIVFLYGERSSIDWHQMSLSFLVGLWLPLIALPFVFLLKLISDYELAFIKFRWAHSSTPAGYQDKIVLILAVRTNLTLLHQFKPYWAKRISEAQSISEKYEAARLFAGNGTKNHSAV